MSPPLPSSAHVRMHCTFCGEERAFEQPTCADGHPTDCPDWACLDCGMGVFLAVASVEAPAQPLRRSA